MIGTQFTSSAGAQAYSTITIKADGTIEGTDLIQRNGNSYTFRGNITGFITIQKDNIVLDGAGYWLQADGDAFTLQHRSNVTIENTMVNATAGTGMMVTQASGCKIFNVSIKAERAGIRLRNVSYTTIANSYVEAKVEIGVAIGFSPNNVVTNNTIVTSMIDAVNCAYSANNVISGNNLTYRPSQFPLAFGIEFDGSASCTISGNTISGFPMAGVNLQSSSDSNQVNVNQVVNCKDGIRIANSKNNNLTANHVANSSEAGITLDAAPSNILRSNSLTDNSQDLLVTSYTSAGWINDVDASNTVEGNPIIYWVNEAGKVVPSNAGYIVLVNCTSITVENFTFEDKSESVWLAYTTDSKIANNNLLNNSTVHLYSSSRNNITQNTIKGNSKGLYLESSSFDNVISNNVISDNNYGISFSSSSSNNITSNNFTDNQNALYFNSASGNSIFINNFINNNRHAYDVGMESPYSSAVPAAFSQHLASFSAKTLGCRSVEPANFIGPPPLSVNNWDNGSRGNFWSDYNGTDANGDGIGDTPYYLYGNNQDNYPLIQPTNVEIAELPYWIILPIALTATLLTVLSARKISRKRTKHPRTP